MTTKHLFKKVLPSLEYIASTFPAYPDQKHLARLANLNSHDFQIIFSKSLGVSVKEFMQNLFFLRARHTLRGPSSEFSTITDYAAKDYIQITCSNTPRRLSYTICESRFGNILVAGDAHGTACVLFVDAITDGLNEEQMHGLYTNMIQFYYPDTICNPGTTDNLHRVEQRLAGNEKTPLRIHLNATAFQMNVYNALIQIPSSQLRTYTEIAKHIGNPKAVRAVGTAVGKNPVSLIIPCHRVVPARNSYGKYRWGSGRKIALLAWEAIQEKELL